MIGYRGGSLRGCFFSLSRKKLRCVWGSVDFMPPRLEREDVAMRSKLIYSVQWQSSQAHMEPAVAALLFVTLYPQQPATSKGRFSHYHSNTFSAHY